MDRDTINTINAEEEQIAKEGAYALAVEGLKEDDLVYEYDTRTTGKRARVARRCYR